MTQSCLSRMDVVGYSNIYSNDPDGVRSILSSIVEKLKGQIDNYNKASGNKQKIKFHQMYGDTLDIHFNLGKADGILLIALLDITCNLQKMLLDAGLMVRGAIVTGDLVDNVFLFTGEAMVQAHNMEHELDPPHLRMSEAVIDILRNQIKVIYPNEKDSKSYLKKTIYDGNKLDYYNHPCMILKTDPISTHAELCKAMGDATKLSLDNCPDEESMGKAKKLLAGLDKYCDYCTL